MEPARARVPESATAQVGPPLIKEVPVEWDGAASPVMFANFVSGIVDNLGDIIVSIGQLEPPLITGANAEERQRAVEQIASIKGRILLRFSVSPERLRDMIDRINQILEVRQGWRRDVLNKEEPTE